MKKRYREREVTALHRLASAPGSVDEELVIHEVLTAIGEVVGCERPLLVLWEPGAEEMWLHLEGSAPLRASTAEPSVVRRVFRSGRGELINDLVTDPDSNPVLTDAVDARQVVTSPLIAGGHKLGVAAAINSRRGRFTQEDLVSLSVLADEAALVIENAQLRSTQQRQAQEIEGLHRFSRLLASLEGVDRAVAESVRIVCDLLSCEKCTLLLHDEETDELVAHPRAAGLTRKQIEGLQFSLAEPSLVGTAFRTDAPLVSHNARTDRWVDAQFQELLEAETALVVPLTTTGRVIGVLAAVNATRGHFDVADVRFATLLGGRIGSAIEAGRARERERGLLHKLRELDHAKSEFVSMLAHELKGPMTTVKGFGEVLRDQWDAISEDKRDHILAMIAREIDRLSRLVHDLLDVSRLEAGTLRCEMGSVSVPELVANFLEEHASLRERHSVVSDIRGELPPVWADADRVRQVLLNLTTNAVRHSPEGSTVRVGAEVTTRDGERHVLVSVADQGIGIAPDDRDRVFTKFVTIGKPAWITKGTGLGLFITRGIVESHGGGIWVESEVGKGSTFYFTLRPTEESA